MFLRCATIFAGGYENARDIHALKETIAFCTLVAEPDARSLFLRLLREGTPAGQLYGLAGLRYTDTELFAKEVVPFIGRMDRVLVTAGFHTEFDRMGRVVFFEHGIRLAPGESLAAWKRRMQREADQGNAASEEALYYLSADIYGGVIPLNLMGEGYYQRL